MNDKKRLHGMDWLRTVDIRRLVAFHAGLLLSLVLSPWAKGRENEMVKPKDITTIYCSEKQGPLRTAALDLQRFLQAKNGEREVFLVSGKATRTASGRIVLKTESQHSPASDAYKIEVIGDTVTVSGCNPRSVLYGVFELEDLWTEKESLPENFLSKGKSAFPLRLLHPRARGGFHSYEENDFAFILRAGANVAHLSHDWMQEKTLLSFVPCEAFPNATPREVLDRNRESLRRYLDLCTRYGLSSALWLCEIVCQGGPWMPEEARKAFLDRFPEEVLGDTGTYQGKVLCMAHPQVEEAYRSMTRQLLTDFPELDMFLVFTIDANGELCDPTKCPRHRGISKYTQYNRLLRLLAEEAQSVKPEFQVFSIGWSWTFRNDPDYLSQFLSLPKGVGLTAPPDAEAWSFDRKLTDKLLEYRGATKKQGRTFLGYDIFLWGDDCFFPETELFDFPLGVAAKLKRWKDLGAEGFFDQWGTQAEFVPANAIALRKMLFHPALTEKANAEAFAVDLASSHYGHSAGRHVFAAWEEIEKAQQLQSDHTYYWHHLRPNWAGAVLDEEVDLNALETVTLAGLEPSKTYGDIDYCPHSGNEVKAAEVLGEALEKAADHFTAASVHLQAALASLDPDVKSCYEHWYPPREDNSRHRLTPKEALEKQLVAVELHAKNQRRMAGFFARYAESRK